MRTFSILKSIAKTVIIKPFAAASWTVLHPYYVVRASWPVFNFLNREGRRLFQEYGMTPSGVQQRIIRTLKTQGVALTHINELFPEKNMLAQLQDFSLKEIAEAKVGRKKTFLRYAWRDSAGLIVFNLANPLVGLAIEPKALEIINAYMEMFSKLDFYSLASTVPVPINAEPTGSQRWHRDPGDKRICKMFLYLSDADEGAGPFCYVPGSHEGGKWRQLFPPQPEDGYYPPSGEVEKYVPHEDIKVCTGRAGTIIFADTTGLHKGGYSTAKERIMFTAGYSAKRSLNHPIKYRYPENFEEEIKALAPIQRYAIDNR